MNTLLHRNPRTLVPDLIDWFEEPFLTLRPYLAQALPVEEYTEDDHYVVRAEPAGIDPENDVEVTVGSGYLTIRAVRHGTIEGKHRTEFRYGAFDRALIGCGRPGARKAPGRSLAMRVRGGKVTKVPASTGH